MSFQHNYRLLLAQHTNLTRPPDFKDAPGSTAKLTVAGHAVRIPICIIVCILTRHLPRLRAPWQASLSRLQQLLWSSSKCSSRCSSTALQFSPLTCPQEHILLHWDSQSRSTTIMACSASGMALARQCCRECGLVPCTQCFLPFRVLDAS